MCVVFSSRAGEKGELIGFFVAVTRELGIEKFWRDSKVRAPFLFRSCRFSWRWNSPRARFSSLRRLAPFTRERATSNSRPSVRAPPPHPFRCCVEPPFLTLSVVVPRFSQVHVRRSPSPSAVFP